MSVQWQGVFPAATTEFLADQSRDLAATMRHLDAMIGAGIHGLMMLGTVGENYSIEYAEEPDVHRATVKQVAGRSPVLTGVVVSAWKPPAFPDCPWRERNASVFWR